MNFVNVNGIIINLDNVAWVTKSHAPYETEQEVIDVTFSAGVGEGWGLTTEFRPPNQRKTFEPDDAAMRFLRTMETIAAANDTFKDETS